MAKDEKKSNLYLKLKDYLGTPPKSRREPFIIGRTPQSLIDLGADDLSLVMRRSEIEKCIAKKRNKNVTHPHGLSVKCLSKIPEQLAGPVMVFKGSHKGSLVVLTDLSDKKGDPIIITVQLKSKQDRHIVNRVTSMYGRENAFLPFRNKRGKLINGYIKRNVDAGNLLGYDKEKAPSYFNQAGLSLPVGGIKTGSYSNSLPQFPGNVNTQFLEKNQKMKGNEMEKNEYFARHCELGISAEFDTEKLRDDYVKVSISNGHPWRACSRAEVLPGDVFSKFYENEYGSKHISSLADWQEKMAGKKDSGDSEQRQKSCEVKGNER
ncbi:MAG: hypothetical protein FWG91_10270 [Lachnospiraceae bacterium]|nr:hypothetical protein [Lachnospiraceae bacterium]